MASRIRALIDWVNNNNTIVTVLVLVVIAGSMFSIINSLGEGNTDGSRGIGPAHEWFLVPLDGSIAAGVEAEAYLDTFEQWERSPEGLMTYLPARIIVCPQPDGTKQVVDVLLYSSSDGSEYDKVSSVFDPLNWHDLPDFDASASDPAEALHSAYEAFGRPAPTCASTLAYHLPEGPFDYAPEFLNLRWERTATGTVRAVRPDTLDEPGD